MGGDLQRPGNFHTECFGGFEVDEQLKFYWLRDQQIGGRGSLEDSTGRFRPTSLRFRSTLSLARERDAISSLD
jgi:hypothetical protein